ncbi:MAG: glycosyltransferase, partial [Magnetococcus sp. YQC-3]
MATSADVMHSAMNDPKLSIIIPVLDDGIVLHHLIVQLGAQSLQGVEIIVADGGSKDGSQSLAHQLGVRVVVSDPGRGRQMNAASREARGQQLLFLHADSHLPHARFLEDAFNFMAPILSAQPRTAGHFSLRFVDPPRGREWLMKFWEEKTRCNRPESIHGDQGLWISRPFFAEIGGFDTTYPFLEERRVVQEVSRLGQWVVLPGPLGTSARRFCTEGLARRTLLNALIMVCHELAWHEFLQQAPDLYRQQSALTNTQSTRPSEQQKSKPLGLRPKPRWEGETPSQTHP